MGNKIDIVKEHNELVNKCLNEKSTKKSRNDYAEFIQKLSKEQLEELGNTLFYNIREPIKSLLIRRFNKTLEIKKDILKSLERSCEDCEVSPKTLGLLLEYDRLGKEEMKNIEVNGKTKRVKSYECSKIDTKYI
jgi:hypothetical protein